LFEVDVFERRVKLALTLPSVSILCKTSLDSPEWRVQRYNNYSDAPNFI